MTALEVTLPPETGSPGRARRLLHEVLVHDPSEVQEVAALLVSEVVTNAVLHAGTDIDVRISYTGTTLRIEVTDRSPVLPSRHVLSDDAATGRGMLLVDQLSDAWGARTSDTGKTVWFELEATASAR